MKILVISDVHSNIDALHALEKAESSWDQLWFLGDMVDYGFYPHETVSWLREHDAICVMGNHDRRLLREYDSDTPCPAPEKAVRFIDHNRALVTPEDIEYIRAIPEERILTADGIKYFMQHSYNVDDQQHVLEEQVAFNSGATFEKIWSEKVGAANFGDERRIVYGHTHQCTALFVRYNTMLLNPGSLSYRLGRDGCCKGGSYMIIRDGDPLMRYLSYDTSAALKIAEGSSLEGTERSNAISFFSPDRL